MMNPLMLSTLTFLIVSPAISICDEDLSKTSPSDEDATKHPLYAGHDDESDYINENSVNYPWSMYRQIRAPSGFMGVRGKKDFEPAKYWELVHENAMLSSQPKRAPTQAFFGMRGKKFSDYKRAPSGFLGVRGKKDDFEDPSDEDLQAELYRELLVERERIANLMEDMEDYIVEDKDKRKPSGFVGLRGKKSVDNDDYYEYEKRAPMGFQGVRGKKSEFPNYIGFDEKRVPVTGFFGMRGKKQPFGGSSSFFGVRKKPYLPYGKFVGVRGKKSGDGNQGNVLTPSQRTSDTTQDKRIGFIGMRG